MSLYLKLQQGCNIEVSCSTLLYTDKCCRGVAEARLLF